MGARGTRVTSVATSVPITRPARLRAARDAYGDPMRIGFWGANGTVTGSRAIVETDGARILVDCGLFQGERVLRARNRAPFPVDPATLDAVLLTHGHVDHSGFLPALVRDGFRGPIWCTPGTADVCRLLLPDAARLQEEEAYYANRHGTSRHHPAVPLYTTEDAERAVEHLRPQPFLTTFMPVRDLRVTYTHAGHIIGASSVHLDDGEVRVTFSGDLGRPRDPVMRTPAPPLRSDVLVVESTYGDRCHPADDGRQVLARITRETIDRGGTLLIPAFAVGRTQEMLYVLGELRDDGAIPDVPIFLNSPMATDATNLFLRYRDEHRLSASQCRRMSRRVHYVRTVDGSKSLTRDEAPKIVISASGMATGGRVLHHLMQLAPDPRHTVLFVGHQAVGTRGHAIVGGASHVRIYGTDVPIRARIEHLQTLSAHADAEELVGWMARMSHPPVRTYVVHGEPEASSSLRRLVQQRLGWRTEIPSYGDVVDTRAYVIQHREVPAHA